jgi:hypothetical protein
MTMRIGRPLYLNADGFTKGSVTAEERQQTQIWLSSSPPCLVPPHDQHHIAAAAATAPVEP